MHGELCECMGVVEYIGRERERKNDVKECYIVTGPLHHNEQKLPGSQIHLTFIESYRNAIGVA